MAISNTATEFVSRAPTRIDLGGGTIDIWPIYHYLHNPVTVNLGISVFAESRLRVKPRSSRASARAVVILRSLDQGKEARIPLKPGWEKTDVGPALSLHRKFLHHFLTRASEKKTAAIGELLLETRARSPAGAGLGGSSTLAISMLGALNRYFRLYTGPQARERLVEVARDTETTIIQVPAGVQDYYGAAFGGLQILGWSTPAHERRSLPSSVASDLGSRLLLFYSGQSRNSGINNWVLFKKFIDGNADVRARFQRLSDAAGAMASALENRDWKAVGRAIRMEWETRRKLASGIETPPMARAMRRALAAGASATKVCGAGGGGCFFIYMDVAEPALKERVRRAVLDRDAGIRELDFEVSESGLDCR